MIASAIAFLKSKASGAHVDFEEYEISNVFSSKYEFTRVYELRNGQLVNKKTGRIVISSDACERGSFLHNIAANVTQLAFDHLDAPPVVVGARNWITPPFELEDMFFPGKDWIIDAIHERILPLPGYVTTSNQTNGEMIRRNRLGI